MLEKDVVAAIKAYLRTLGTDVFFWKEHGGPYGTSGVPDIICCYKGRFLGLEVKLPKGRLTVLQERAIEKINAAGGIARRVESVEDVQAVIRQVDAEHLKALGAGVRDKIDEAKRTGLPVRYFDAEGNEKKHE